MMQPSSPRSRLYADGPQVVALPPLERRWLIAPFVVLASLWTWIGHGLLQSAVRSDFAAMTAAAGALCILIFCLIKVRRDDRQRRMEFLAALQDLDLATLQHSATSPLVDDVSRQLLVTYLNRRYPGWSTLEAARKPQR